MAPRKVNYQETTIWNPPDHIYEELGYYPITYTDMPDDAPEGYHYESHWEQDESEIVQVWDLVEDSDEISDEEALAIILGV